MKTHNDPLCRREFLTKATQAAAAVTVSAGVVSATTPFAARAGAPGTPRGPRISYHCNGEIYVNEVGKPEGKPLTTGHWDAKPSWSKTGDMLICFRRLADDPVTGRISKSAIFIIHVDGAGFHTLSDGTRSDFNPTWTRDGLNTPIWNRGNGKNAGFHVVQSKVGAEPGEEVAITDERFHTWAHSCLMDGRILVNASHPTLGLGVFLLTRREGAKPLYERVQCELVPQGQMHRASISPSEKKICFEYLPGHKFKEPGHTLYIGDFDAQQRTVTNLKTFANAEGKPSWFAYPRWIEGESAVVYHLNKTGKGQLYVYRLDDGSTTRVSTNPKSDYLYPHGEAAPC